MTTQAISTIIIPSMIPTCVIETDTVEFIPYIRMGKVTYTPEREVGRNREGEIVADILDGQLTDVVRVIAFDEKDGTCYNATRDIADQVFNALIRSGSNVPEYLADFLHENIADREIAPYLRNRLAA